jgi:glutamine amidotransferase
VCRHLAYVGEPVLLASLLTEPEYCLVRQSWAPRRQQHGVVNADGFGIGWYVDGLLEPARHRGAGPIWADETVTDLARVIRSGAVLAAVRSATIGMAHGPAGAAPFRSGKWLFSHNGAVDGWPAVASGLAWGLDPGALAQLEAPTDSALLWAMIRDLLARGKPPESALAEVVSRTVEAGGGRLTMLLTDGRSITATVWGTSLCWRRLPGGVVVASEPYDDDPSWVEVPDGSLLVADRDGVDIEPLIPARAAPPS